MDKQVKARNITVFREETEVGSFKTVDAKVYDAEGNEVTCQDSYPPQRFEIGMYDCE